MESLQRYYDNWKNSCHLAVVIHFLVGIPAIIGQVAELAVPGRSWLATALQVRSYHDFILLMYTSLSW